MMCKDKEKLGPSGMSWNQAFSLSESWGGRDCLLMIDDLSVIEKLKQEWVVIILFCSQHPSFWLVLRRHIIHWQLLSSHLKMYGLYLLRCYH